MTMVRVLLLALWFLGTNADGSAVLETTPSGERALYLLDGTGRVARHVQLAANGSAVTQVILNQPACFTAGTQVVTAEPAGMDEESSPESGSIRLRLKWIEDVTEGDWVLSADETSGRIAPCRVGQASRRLSNHLRYVVLRDPASEGEQTIETTDEHPFWVAGRRSFVEAKELAEGDQVVGPGGELQVVAATRYEPHPQGVPVFNFTVEGCHTYFVLARGSRGPPVWVHNAPCPGNVQTPRIHMPRVQHGNDLHWSEMLEASDNMVQSGMYRDIYVNRGLRAALPELPTNWRPDVWGVRWNGTIDLIEVVSPSQRLRDIRNKIRQMETAIGSVMGDSAVWRPPY